MAKPDRLIQSAIRTRYVVTQDTGETWDGVLVEADDQHLVLADASAISPNGDRLPVDGQLWLPRIAVKYMQKPNG